MTGTICALYTLNNNIVYFIIILSSRLLDIISVLLGRATLTGMGVPEMRATVGVELVSERVSFVNWTLGDVRYTVVVLSSLLVNSVPMDH